MDGAPIVVHRPRGTGGRRVTVRGQIIGLAHSDRVLVEFLRQAGIDETTAEAMVDGDSRLIEWRGGRAHEYEAA
ncbi:hypothetical protein [Streptomyces sp. CBMA152]|uniref:hypothetical protein n=1 Tax=Streptomyces sp. CBMA152 TaxID=1896312 RepID=UPI0016605427|nr:hypothetical protein [Streptomyces sp. CBMA152]MBD0743620.1 hypothetical protein [Streptomyces sp. CBMA152]